MRILVTGASGFLGAHICSFIKSDTDLQLTECIRNARGRGFAHGESCIVMASIDAESDWSDILAEQDVVIHCAARAHIMDDEVADPLAEYRKTNVYGTLNLAHQASIAGVKRFVFISSIKVNGEGAILGSAYQADDTPAPEDNYGISKWEAEQGLLKLAADTNMEVVIIRPPLVYGLGVKGNLAGLFKLVEAGMPLPLGAIRNKRSLVAIDNLVDLIVTCVDHPAAANQIFLAGDGRDLSTAELLRLTAKAMGKPSRLIPVPAPLLLFGATLLGKKAVAQRLFGSLQVDISKTRELLDWEPPVTVEEGLQRCFQSV